MGNIDLETAVQFVTILGGTIAVLLAILQIIETYLDIGEKLRKRRLARRQKRSEQMERTN